MILLRMQSRTATVIGYAVPAYSVWMEVVGDSSICFFGYLLCMRACTSRVFVRAGEGVEQAFPSQLPNFFVHPTIRAMVSHVVLLVILFYIK